MDPTKCYRREIYYSQDSYLHLIKDDVASWHSAHLLFQFDVEPSLSIRFKVSRDVREPFVCPCLCPRTLCVLDFALLSRRQILIVHFQGSCQVAPKSARFIRLLLLFWGNNLWLDFGGLCIKQNVLFGTLFLCRQDGQLRRLGTKQQELF